MNPSWRKPFGMLAILMLIVVWVVIVASFSAIVWNWHWLAQLVFYIVTGLIWIAPLKPMLSWMETGKWRSW
ncbi:DUF2842 domain-containing protein [Sphingomonas immobilis]|uniref:DUF2842 domain-containing protein n=1 Tax=Sphingomonas immobilis TaxID=3063997 RepID=A0ABT8ZY20_9SPHN|nr:DUF2842 domain-containing protein [Sphingomonas sp. CA1-15]MDO7842475.1 DUF2842 domain-containing protein [Sphingomonas sp. CA1-15]